MFPTPNIKKSLDVSKQSQEIKFINKRLGQTGQASKKKSLQLILQGDVDIPSTEQVNKA